MFSDVNVDYVGQDGEERIARSGQISAGHPSGICRLMLDSPSGRQMYLPAFSALVGKSAFPQFHQNEDAT